MRFPRLRQLANPYLLTERLLLKALGLCSSYVQGQAADFGCGDFRLSRGFQKHLTDLIGIDNWLPARFHASTPDGARFYYASVQQTPFSDEAFDTVFCTEVIEHADRPDLLMGECCRVMKPGGHVVISAPFNFFVHGAPNDFRRYTIYGLERLVTDSGLEMVVYLHVGGGVTSLLNHLLTSIGFSGSGRVGPLRRLAVVGLNFLGLLAIRLKGAPVVLKTTDASLNDRTQPLGYVLVARRPGEASGRAASKNVIVCPACHGEIAFGPPTATCNCCGKSYPYFDGVPVLAPRDQLHLVVESTGERIDL